MGELVVEQAHVGQDGESVRRAPHTRVSSVVARDIAHVQQGGDAKPQVRSLERELAVSETRKYFVCRFKEILKLHARLEIVVDLGNKQSSFC